ncbi:NADPH-dependent ferric siderophore reductase [Jatrophihabitans sp. GAS493]|uniref:siderophore-interacting protein n=1 Tax=Jatrophihabitans sp. GAS493 TaxID=1907575 RepID=UPI000BB91FC5|nr:siderophore-interacting protein [Jatrophihabitans sp. GAS493]SOD72463.1 NADPH-dependent ferric siderophore reductase [Jatrophihabitans sp. GAS493]
MSSEAITTEPAATTPRRPNDQSSQPRIPYRATVQRVQELTPSMVRVVVGGADLARFAEKYDGSEATDAYVKVVFLTPGVTYPQPLDLATVRTALPREHQPRLRTYTVRAFDRVALELTLDFVVHGDSGLAGPWAAQAAVGDELLLLGPGGGYRPDADADWYLFVGDESAIPAIAVAAERLPDGARAQILIEVHDAADEVAINTTADVTWLHRGDAPVGSRVVDEVNALTFPTGRVDAFVHGEAGFVKQLRRLLLNERGVAREQLSISGYWRLGSDDEAWRAAKAEWARD